MENNYDNMDPVKMLLHAGVMMIFSGALLAATVNILYGVCLWIGAAVCFTVAKRRDTDARENSENDTEEIC